MHKRFANAFVIVFFGCALLSMGRGPRDTDGFYGVLRPALRFLKLEQNWGMFARGADNPAKYHDRFMEADIRLADGTRTSWSTPRMQELSEIDRLVKDRYRTLFKARRGPGFMPRLWRDIALYLSEKYTTELGPPSEIELRVHIRRAFWQEAPQEDQILRRRFTAEQLRGNWSPG